jgi:hypothetical protein
MMVMRSSLTFLLMGACLIGSAESQVVEKPLTSVEGLQLINVKAEVVEHSGFSGLQVTRSDDYTGGGTLVLIEGSTFEDGTIELELAGEPAAGADLGMRGFIGVAFRVDPEDVDRYECFYLRPVNGRADNQLQRNHSTQYVSHPEYPWYRLREASPGIYESYVDLVPSAWTKVRIEVDGTTAGLYVHGADQPTLMVSDLKHGDSSGLVGLWLHSSTLAYFRDLTIVPAE